MSGGLPLFRKDSLQKAAVCRGDGSCVVSVLAKGKACRTKVEEVVPG